MRLISRKVSWFERRSGAIRHAAVNACLVRLCSLHGKAVTTIEGLGSTRTRLHPLQVNFDALVPATEHLLFKAISASFTGRVLMASRPG